MLGRVMTCLFLGAVPALAGGLFDLDGKPIDEYVIRMEGRAWLGEAHGRLEVDEGDVKGDRVDLDDDLDIETQVVPEGVVTVRFSRFRIEARYFQQKFEGEAFPQETFTYKGTTYNTFDNVESEVRVRAGGIDAEFLLFDLGSHSKVGFELGIGVGGRYLYAEGAITRDPGGPRERKDNDTVIPVARVSASFGFLNFASIDADVEGMYLRYRNVRSQYIDATVQVKVYLHHLVWLTAGYRYSGIGIQDRRGDNFDAELAIRGFFAGLGLQF